MDTAKQDIVLIFGDVGFLRVASTGVSDPNELLEMLQSISKVPVKMEIQIPSRFTPEDQTK